ncbi:zinc finger protein 84-like [Seriola aureovittata]|uniref:zinc finger protein 84-like n=1 Tax=Seriola aureovittata TaxID=2871759 RepID=UPI0024BD9842|nr:zinc finger protein 84-like [Seriola aureovittata]
MSASQTFLSTYPHCREHLSMVKTAKIELLRALISECLSAAAEEIFKVAERTIIEYEEEMSCSKWVVDSHRRLLDVVQSHSEDYLQVSATELHSRQLQPPASISVRWEEPDNTTSQPTEDCRTMNNTNPHASPDHFDDFHRQEILIDIDEDDNMKDCDLNVPLKILKVKKLFKCPVCFSGFSSKKTMVRHVKKHSEDKSSYQCQFCDCYFCHKSEFIIHTRIHKGSKPYRGQDCDKSFDQRDNLFSHGQKPTKEKPYQCFSEKMNTESHVRLMTPASKMEEVLDPRQDESGLKTFPLTITAYDKSEFDQESLQPLCLYQIQAIADIDKDSSAPLTVDHIKTEPTGADGGVLHTNTDDQLLLSVNPSEQHEGETEPNHLRPSRKSTELIDQFEAGTAQKPYKCPCCTKCFSLTKTLIRHARIHTEEKPYQCQFCGRNFCQKSDLVNHMRIHTGERPYQCQECKKSFAQKGNLVVHMRKHRRETISVPRVQL